MVINPVLQQLNDAANQIPKKVLTALKKGITLLKKNLKFPMNFPKEEDDGTPEWEMWDALWYTINEAMWEGETKDLKWEQGGDLSDDFRKAYQKLYRKPPKNINELIKNIQNFKDLDDGVLGYYIWR